MIALGVDPGLANTGYAIVNRHTATGKLSLTASGIVKTSAVLPDSKRAMEVYSSLKQAVYESAPDLLAVEKVFFNRNVSSAISTGGVLYICLVDSRAVECTERPDHATTSESSDRQSEGIERRRWQA